MILWAQIFHEECATWCNSHFWCGISACWQGAEPMWLFSPQHCGGAARSPVAVPAAAAPAVALYGSCSRSVSAWPAFPEAHRQSGSNTVQEHTPYLLTRIHCAPGIYTIPYRLVGLVVKASTSRAENLRFESQAWIRQDFFRVKSYQWLKHWHSSGYPARCLVL